MSTREPNLTQEQHALCEHSSFIDRSTQIDLYEMTGEDRQRFLNGLVTCDVKPLEPGTGTYGFVAQLKGRILADLRVLALDDRLWLELPAGQGAAIHEHLAKYIIVDRVEIAPLEDYRALTLAGAAAGKLLEELCDAEAPTGAHRHDSARIDGAAVRIARDADLGVPAWTLFVSSAQSDRVTAALTGGGARSAGLEVLDLLRIEAGRPLFGRDFDQENFPQETGLEEAVSYTKGCYLGQEVIARIHYRGGVNRHLRGLRFADGAVGAVGQAVFSGGREAGTMTSFAVSPRFGAIGLAILHNRAEPGARVEIAGGGEAEVEELPFG